MNKRGKLITITGLPTTGKSTLVKELSKHPSWISIPERSDYLELENSYKLKLSSSNLKEKKEKHYLFLEIDCKRYKIAQQYLQQAEIVLCIQDFTASLAYNYAERWFFPEMDSYEWLVDTHYQFLKRGKIGLADCYIYLDASLSQRQQRRASDNKQIRNDIFFNLYFAANMRQFYYKFMNPLSEQKVLPTIWYNYSRSCDEELNAVKLELKLIVCSLDSHANKTDIQLFNHVLRSTIEDNPIYYESIPCR